ncbi:MAG: hypothetical protein H7255_18340 [Ramlibacter sp.]|nr:hypothetical protein [Ramlibacter sp.]
MSTTKTKERSRVSQRAVAHAIPKSSDLRFEGGRIVSKTLADPDVAKRVKAIKDKMRADPAKLRATYVKRGILTPGGKLSKAYGG